MVIPWIGFPLNALLKQVDPLRRRATLRFRRCSIRNECQIKIPGVLDWPYVEGLRLDEAMIRSRF